MPVTKAGVTYSLEYGGKEGGGLGMMEMFKEQPTCGFNKSHRIHEIEKLTGMTIGDVVTKIRSGEFGIIEHSHKVDVVPQALVDWITSFPPCVDKYNLLERFLVDYNRVELPNDLYNYYDNNENDSRKKVINVILGGDWEIEEEPKYYIEIIPKDKSMGGWDRLIKSTWSGKLETQTGGSEKFERIYEFTEKEIKEIDKRYWAFAVPVEKEVAENEI